MMTSPNLAGKAHPDIERVIRDLIDTINRLDAHLTATQTQLNQLPAPRALQAISQGLSAAGSAPLDLTGLTGQPATP